MMSSLKRLLWLNRVEPVTHNDVPPAPREPDKEREIKAAQAALAHQLLSVGRTSWEIRQELAGNVLSIVSGD
ncbi:hypothetical protein [Mesorhizobium sp. M2A.F.Ca.ET.039.01.1.1]|uniref:hypothetical protein n=1 Tax=Mesorhizobium sp. M2A.F.Ca.ET.039.01.1.1 TaxID=2496746 RepID=UPI000FCAE439|nr:hypothetical protein [Mesorhizobium sp. M2A.F.Ca.ET.039.01.1.1]RWX72616.1 hypothetical protein EOA24_00080 [Mesorhizobium sp. M2A.F.Ca.ET.039.01.1.1]